jgi:hypothetical protein
MKTKTADDIQQRMAELGADVDDQAFMAGYLLSMVADQCNEFAQFRRLGMECPFFKIELIFNSLPETRQ